MTNYVFPPPDIVSVPVVGLEECYPIARIFCVGRNYAAHAVEMGNEVDRDAPFYFSKTPAHVLESGATWPYPPGTENLHHEMELAVYIGEPVFRANFEQAHKAICGYSCALDMTRRDLQAIAKEKRRPWDLSKDFEGAAVLAPMTPATAFGGISNQRIWLTVNGEIRQDASVAELIHGVEDIICDLSQYYHLAPGDVILTGTPAGVGPVKVGDVLEGAVDGLERVTLKIGRPE